MPLRRALALLSAAATVLLLHPTDAKFYSDCGSKLARLDAVSVSGCTPDANECVLRRDSNVTFDIDFTTNAAVKSVETVVHGIILNLPVPFPLPQPDACRDSGLVCPLQANQKYSYRANMPVLKSYPKVSVEVKWELQSETEEDLICIAIAAKLR